MLGPRALVLAFAAGALVYVAVGVAGAPEGAVLATRDILQLVASAAAALLCARTALRARGIQRAGWLAMSAATGAWALGQVAWTWYEVWLGVGTPIPSWADAGYLAFYPLAAVAIALLAQPRRTHIYTLLGPVADGMLVAGAAFLLAWPLFLHAVYEAAGASAAAPFVVGYVAGDIAIASLAVGLILRAMRSSREQPILILVGVLLMTVADVALAAGVLGEGYSTGRVLDVGWLLGPGAFALAALRAKPPATPRPTGAMERGIPLAAVVVGVASFGFSLDHAYAYAVQGSVFAVTVSLAIVRQVAHGREHERLARERARVNEALVEAQRIARLGSWTLDWRTGAIDWSPAAIDLLRVPPGAPMPDYERMLARLEPDARARVRSGFERALSEGRPGTFEVEVRRLDGTPMWARIYFARTRGRDGAPVLHGTLQDIDERKRAQIAAREAAELTETMLAAAPVVLGIVDEAGRLRRWNRELSRLSGYTDAELAGRKLDDFLATGAPDGETGMVGRDGSVHPVYRVVKPFGDPAHRGRLVMALDLTELKREHAAAESASELTRAVFDTMPAMIAVIDRTGKLVKWNAELERATGWSAEEIAARNATDFIVPEQHALVAAAVREAFETGSAQVEVSILHKDGAARPSALAGRRFGDPADPFVVGVAVDVEARRRAEAALRRNERLTSLGTLVAGVAHEINNPLTYIRGGVELIERSVDELAARHPELAKEMADMRSDAQTALRGLDRIAAITSGLRKIARAPVNDRREASMNDVVNDILPIAKPRLGPDVLVELDLRSAQRLRINVEEISQVVLNLLFNAGDAMREKGGTLRISTREDRGDTLLEIADTGVGIPREKQAQIFAPFFTTKPEGTGLGLSVSRSIALDHGGDLGFESIPGRGTIFRLRLPFRPPAVEVAP